MRWNSIAQERAWRSWASAAGVRLSIGRHSRLGEIAGAGSVLCDLEPASRERVQHRRGAVGAGVLAYPGRVLGDEPVAVELDRRSLTRPGGAVGHRRAADQRWVARARRGRAA